MYREYAPGLYRYAGMLAPDAAAAQDALQETFLRYFVSRSEGKAIDNPKAWLYRVLRNYLMGSARAAGARLEVAMDPVPDTGDHSGDPESAYFLADFIRRAQDTLAPREMECVRLRHEGLNYEEIADTLEIRPGTVGALLARAYKKIRRLQEPARLPLGPRLNNYAS